MDVRYDFFGQELQVGDTVIWGTTTGQPRGFDFGVICRFTPKMIEVQYFGRTGSAWDKVEQKWLFDQPMTSKVYPDQLCKVDPELVTMKLLKGK